MNVPPRLRVNAKAGGMCIVEYSSVKSLPRSAAPIRGSGALAPKGSPEWRLEQRGKERAEYKKLVIAKPVRKLAVAIRIPLCIAGRICVVS